MFENILITIITALAGAVTTIIGYWTGRKKRDSENAKDKASAIKDLNETIDEQGARINDLYEVVLALKSENYKLSTQNEELLANQRSLLEEIEGLRRELAQYKRPEPEEPFIRKPVPVANRKPATTAKATAKTTKTAKTAKTAKAEPAK